MSDEILGQALCEIHAANFSVYGTRKMWKAMRRAGHDVGRDQVARLMKRQGLYGVRRAKKVRTTRRDDSAPRSPDLVERNFTASSPNRLWVTDLTYVPTWQGVAYVCFITDVFSRMIVGWRVAGHMRTDMVLDALEMARWQRGTRFDDLRLHSDAGSQFTSIRYSERLDEIGARPSIGSIGDSFDNALAESVNALYKTELTRGPGRGPWRTIDDLELQTLAWVHWHNNERLHSYLGDVPPLEFRGNLRCNHQRNLADGTHKLRVSIRPSAIQFAHITKVCLHWSFSAFSVENLARIITGSERLAHLQNHRLSRRQ